MSFQRREPLIVSACQVGYSHGTHLCHGSIDQGEGDPADKENPNHARGITILETRITHLTAELAGRLLPGKGGGVAHWTISFPTSP